MCMYIFIIKGALQALSPLRILWRVPSLILLEASRYVCMYICVFKFIHECISIPYKSIGSHENTSRQAIIPHRRCAASSFLSRDVGSGPLAASNTAIPLRTRTLAAILRPPLVEVQHPAFTLWMDTVNLESHAGSLTPHSRTCLSSVGVVGRLGYLNAAWGASIGFSKKMYWAYLGGLGEG